MNRKRIFDTVRKLLGGAFTQGEVDALDRAIDLAQGEEGARTTTETDSVRVLGAAGASPIRTCEGCARRTSDGTLAAYPDPGSVDGRP